VKESLCFRKPEPVCDKEFFRGEENLPYVLNLLGREQILILLEPHTIKAREILKSTHALWVTAVRRYTDRRLQDALNGTI